MPNFVLSLICPQPHQSPQIFANYSINSSDLVLSLEFPYQLQIFVIVLWFIWQTREDIIISYLTLAQLHAFTKKDTNLYIITMLSYFLLWSKNGHKQQWWTYWTCTFWLRLDISSLSNCACSICLSLLFVSYFWSNYDVPRTKEFFVLFTAELLRVKRKWSSDSKVNVVKYILKCTITLVWLCLVRILLWPAWLAFLSVGHQSGHHINPVFFQLFGAVLFKAISFIVLSHSNSFCRK